MRDMDDLQRLAEHFAWLKFLVPRVHTRFRSEVEQEIDNLERKLPLLHRDCYAETSMHGVQSVDEAVTQSQQRINALMAKAQAVVEEEEGEGTR